MEKKITKRVVNDVTPNPAGPKVFQENTVELVQTYDDASKKLKSTVEVRRVKGALFRLAQKGEKPDERLMDEATWSIRALVQIPSVPASAPAAEPPPEPAPEPSQLTSAAQLSEPSLETVVALAAPESPLTAPAEKPKAAAKGSKKGPKKQPKKKAAKAAEAVPENGFNENEKRVLSCFSKDPVTIKKLAATAFPKFSDAKANSWVRNSLRRLVLSGKVAKVDRGTYALVS